MMFENRFEIQGDKEGQMWVRDHWRNEVLFSGNQVECMAYMAGIRYGLRLN